MTDARARFQAAADLFLAARDLPADRVDQFVEAACGGDAELLRQVRTLLSSADDSDIFLTLAGQLRAASGDLGDAAESTQGSSGLGTALGGATQSFDQLESRIGNYDLTER